MENYQFWTIVGMIGASFAWIMHKFEKVQDEQKSQSERLARIEGLLMWFEKFMFTGSDKG